jgi:cyclin A
MQTDINAQMRAILIDWLVEVAEEYNLMQETMYICVSSNPQILLDSNRKLTRSLFCRST